MLIYMEVKVSVFCGEGSSFLSELMSFSCVALKCLFSFLLKNEIAVIINSDGSAVKNLPALQEVWETWVLSPGQEDPLEEEMATHSRNPMERGTWRATVYRAAKSQR